VKNVRNGWLLLLLLLNLGMLSRRTRWHSSGLVAQIHNADGRIVTSPGAAANDDGLQDPEGQLLRRSRRDTSTEHVCALTAPFLLVLAPVLLESSQLLALQSLQSLLLLPPPAGTARQLCDGRPRNVTTSTAAAVVDVVGVVQTALLGALCACGKKLGPGNVRRQPARRVSEKHREPAQGCRKGQDGRARGGRIAEG
jgi:hypothetical protein